MKSKYRDLRNCCHDQNGEKWFDNMREWCIGDGSLTRFWEDSWLGEESIASQFPRLFLNSEQKSVLIKDVG